MDEVFPVLAGIVVGLATYGVAPIWLRVVLIGALGLAFGAMASWISGELAVSWIYVLVDTAQVAAASVMTAVPVGVWRRRHARSQAQ